MIALFVGRFQPFHLGHLDAIKQILKKHEKIIIAIGSSQFKNQPNNPFSAKLRRKMIIKSLVAEKIPRKKYSIFEITDINNDNLWVKHVERHVPKFGVIYSGSEHVRKLFRRTDKYKIKIPKFNLKISATMVRKKIMHGQNWEKFVPAAVIKLIKYGH